MGEVTLDFILQDLSDIYEYHPWAGRSVPTACPGDYGAAGTFCWWLKNKPSFIEKILANPSTLEVMEPLIRNTKPDFLDALTLDYEEVLRDDPDQFFNRLNVYLSKVKDDLGDLLKEFNFQDYAKSESGKESLFKAMPILIENLPFEFFENKIYPHIDFGEFLSKMNKPTAENILRSIRNKFDKNTKSFLSRFEKMFQDFVKGFGGGLKGFGALSTLLNIPRLDKHQNYRKVDGEIVASTERPVVDSQGNMVRNADGEREVSLVDVKIPEDEKILGAKNIRDFYKKNENWIKSQMKGTDKEKDIKFLRYMLSASSQQAKQSSLKKEKDKFIEYYNQKYKEGKEKLPGIIVYNALTNPQASELTNKNKFSEGVNSYKFDKKELKSDNFKYLIELLRYYISKSQSKTIGKKIGDAISAIVDVLKSSSFSQEEINEIVFDKLLISGIDKQLSYDSLANWANNIIPFVEDGTLNVNKLVEFLDSKTVRDIVQKESKTSPTTEYKYKDLLSRLKNNSLNEVKIRKYISNLLAYNFKK